MKKSSSSEWIIQSIEEGMQPLHEAEAELCIAQLRNMNSIYSTIIEKKQAEMKYTKYMLDSAKTPAEVARAKGELSMAQSKCVDLFSYWLKELHDMPLSYDKRAFTLHQMLYGNCCWFLAKFGVLKSRGSPPCKSSEENFEEAVAAYDRIFAFLGDDLPTCNSLYVFLLKKYSQLVLDAKEHAVKLSKNSPANSCQRLTSNSENTLASSSGSDLGSSACNERKRSNSVSSKSGANDMDEQFNAQVNINYNFTEEEFKTEKEKNTWERSSSSYEPKLKGKEKQRSKFSRCKQAGVNCIRHLDRIRQSLQLTSGYVSKAVRNGVEDVCKTLRRIEAIDT